MQTTVPKLVTFDGEARSGKGTIVGLVKDYLRDECGYKVMLIDSGQVFRVLVVAMQRAGVDLDSPAAIDAYVGHSENIEANVRFIKQVYRMPKADREALIYTSEIGALSAKAGARPLAQAFRDDLLRKWLRDVAVEGFDVVLLDGRALEEIGEVFVAEGLCEYRIGLFFVCDPVVSAQRTLGRMPLPYEQLDDEFRAQVDDMVAQIQARNQADSERTVHPVVPPRDAPRYAATEVPEQLPARSPRPMVIVDRSIEAPHDTMALPIARMIAKYL